MAYYFAYGSNMSSRQMSERLACDQLTIIGRARLQGYQLVFDKISRDGTGKANLTKDDSGEVWGVVYQLTDEQMSDLDDFEAGYSREKVEVILDDGQRLEVDTYISSRRNPSLRPHIDYVQTIVSGAQENELPEEYILHILHQADQTRA